MKINLLCHISLLHAQNKEGKYYRLQTTCCVLKCKEGPKTAVCCLKCRPTHYTKCCLSTCTADSLTPASPLPPSQVSHSTVWLPHNEHELPLGNQTTDEASVKILACSMLSRDEKLDKWSLVSREKLQYGNRIVSAAGSQDTSPSLKLIYNSKSLQCRQAYTVTTVLNGIWRSYFKTMEDKKYQGSNKQLGDRSSTYLAPLDLNNLSNDKNKQMEVKLMLISNINISQNHKMDPCWL